MSEVLPIKAINTPDLVNEVIEGCHVTILSRYYIHIQARNTCTYLATTFKRTTVSFRIHSYQLQPLRFDAGCLKIFWDVWPFSDFWQLAHCIAIHVLARSSRGRKGSPVMRSNARYLQIKLHLSALYFLQSEYKYGTQNAIYIFINSKTSKHFYRDCDCDTSFKAKTLIWNNQFCVSE